MFCLNQNDLINDIKKYYGLNVLSLDFLPIGADFNTNVFQLKTDEKLNYFLKIRRNQFNKFSVYAPKYLSEQGVDHLIAPIKTINGELWIIIDSYMMAIYPYVKGENAIEHPMSKQQWAQLGRTVKKIHETATNIQFLQDIKHEDFHDEWRKKLTAFILQMLDKVYDDPLVNNVATFLQSKSQEILAFIESADSLANKIQNKQHEFVLCHADIHGWNILIDEYERLFLIDWDTLILSPRERDLMFIGAGIWQSGISSSEEERWFYEGYGRTKVDNQIICYYRLERIIQDIVEYCEHIFLSNDNDENKAVSFEYLKSNFDTNGTLAKAYLIIPEHSEK